VTAEELDRLNRQRLVARLLSATVHDARNALQGISGTAELLTLSPASSGTQTEDRIRSILRQTTWIGERLDQLLKIDVTPTAQLERLDLGRVCARAVDHRLASWGRLRIAAITPPQGLIVYTDFGATMRILLNLILNAEASLLASGGGQITMSASVATTHIALVIADTGPGVPAAEDEHLFTTRTASDHLATGLAASRALAETIGGSLTWLGPGRRAAFELRLRSGR
jgi:two-component system sensor histidine kinase KdpD